VDSFLQILVEDVPEIATGTSCGTARPYTGNVCKVKRIRKKELSQETGGGGL
jgi:hypothetical protein